VGLALLAGLLSLSGCKEKRPSACPVYQQVTHLSPKRSADVVAEVNGHPILAAEVAHRMQAQGIGRRQALAQLIREELLVDQAIAVGLDRDPAVRIAGKQAAVYRLLRAGFEREFTRKDVPEIRLRKAYRLSSKIRYHRPEIRRFAHLYVDRPWSRRGRHFYLDQKRDAALRAAMERLRERIVAAAPTRRKDFTALAQTPEGQRLGLRAQSGTSARKDLRPAFAKVLFSMHRRSEISPVIQTKPWYHIAYLVQIIPATSIPYEQARPEILERLWPGERRRAFAAWIRELKKRCRVQIHPEHLPVTPLDRDVAP
jgi:peptidyl-prolyl cis-trans isomerase C